MLRLQRFLNNPAAFQRTFGRIWAGAENVKLWQLETARIVGSILTLLFIASGLMYEAEKNVNVQFTDFFSALYFGLTTLTTVGFGDIVPVTPAGRATVGLSILFGITIIPVQLSALATALIEDSKLDVAVSDAAAAQKRARNETIEKWKAAAISSSALNVGGSPDANGVSSSSSWTEAASLASATAAAVTVVATAAAESAAGAAEEAAIAEGLDAGACLRVRDATFRAALGALLDAPSAN